MHTRPLVQTDGKVPPQRSATAGEARLEDEKNRSARLALAEALRQQRRIVGNILSHKQPVIRDRVVEYLIVGTTGQIDIADADSVMAAFL
jgi:hypothetical protein